MTLDEVDLLDELEKILCSHKSISSEEKDKLRQHGFIFSIGRALYNLSKENDALRMKNKRLNELLIWKIIRCSCEEPSFDEGE